MKTVKNVLKIAAVVTVIAVSTTLLLADQGDGARALAGRSTATSDVTTGPVHSGHHMAMDCMPGHTGHPMAMGDMHGTPGGAAPMNGMQCGSGPAGCCAKPTTTAPDKK